MSFLRKNIFTLILIIMLILAITLIFIDISTTEIITIEEVKCVDENYNEFKDEWCIKEIRCGAISKILRSKECEVK